MHIEKRGRYQRLYSNRDVPSHTEMVSETIYDLIMTRVELELKMNNSVDGVKVPYVSLGLQLPVMVCAPC